MTKYNNIIAVCQHGMVGVVSRNLFLYSKKYSQKPDRMKSLTSSAFVKNVTCNRVMLLLLLIATAPTASAQWNHTQQKAFNAYVDCANQSAGEIQTIVESIKNYYPTLGNQEGWNQPRYICPVQMDEYYYKTALVSSQQLQSATGALLNKKLNELRDAAQAIDFKCKELDTYHKLQDYNTDHFAKARAMISTMADLSKKYRDAQSSLQETLMLTWERTLAKGDYANAAKVMRGIINHERAYIDLLRLNLNESIHTGWSDSEAAGSIRRSDSLLTVLNAMSPALKYPASSMWRSFKESLAEMIKAKERGWDQYNYNAKKSDRHKNYMYSDLINYFNGTLVSNYNTFVEFSERDQQYQLKMFQYAPVFEILDQVKPTSVAITRYDSIAIAPLGLKKFPKPIDQRTFNSLSEYISFINEGAREVRYLQMVLTNFNSSASYYKGLQSFENRAPMHFSYQEFTLPRSYFHRVISASRNLHHDDADILNARAETLFNILNEMDQHGAWIDMEVASRKYEADKLAGIYTSFDRLQNLFEHWDEQKELLYNDVRSLFNCYPVADTTQPWLVSGNALYDLVSLDYRALMDARKFYKGDSLTIIDATLIDTAVRNVIANEYKNMKDIPKYGRNNGNCPYTPYEDLAAASRRFSEQLKKIKTGIRNSYRHPYNDFVDRYNDIVEDYNSFAELSKDVPILQAVNQTELFFIKYPDSNNLTSTKSTATNQRPKGTSTAKNSSSPTLIRDTVYIEKHDTVYIENEIDYSSMDGFAINNLVLLIDVSASMNSPEKLPLLKSTLLNMLPVMREDDKLTIVAVASKARVVLETTSFKNAAMIEKAISELTPEGKTLIGAGLKIAYKVADENYIRGGNNRVILATDGEFPVSGSLTKLVITFKKKDISLSIFNFASSPAESLEKLAAAGNGNYATISPDNAKKNLFREAKARRIK